MASNQPSHHNFPPSHDPHVKTRPSTEALGLDWFVQKEATERCISSNRSSHISRLIRQACEGHLKGSHLKHVSRLYAHMPPATTLLLPPHPLAHSPTLFRPFPCASFCWLFDRVFFLCPFFFSPTASSGSQDSNFTFKPFGFAFLMKMGSIFMELHKQKKTKLFF